MNFVKKILKVDVCPLCPGDNTHCHVKLPTPKITISEDRWVVYAVQRLRNEPKHDGLKLEKNCLFFDEGFRGLRIGCYIRIEYYGKICVQWNIMSEVDYPGNELWCSAAAFYTRKNLTITQQSYYYIFPTYIFFLSWSINRILICYITSVLYFYHKNKNKRDVGTYVVY